MQLSIISEGERIAIEKIIARHGPLSSLAEPIVTKFVTKNDPRILLTTKDALEILKDASAVRRAGEAP
jgi:hypothetical protein